MKKILTFILLSVIVLCSACEPHAELRLNDPAKIAALYHRHEDLFNRAAETALGMEQIEYIHVEANPDDLRTIPETWTIREKDGLYLITKQPLSAPEYEALFDAFAPLVSVLQQEDSFEGIVKSETIIAFSLEASYYNDWAELRCFQSAELAAQYSDLDRSLLIGEHWTAQIETH